MPSAATTTPHVKLSGPRDLIDVVPYLLGFTPEMSTVFIGMTGGRVVLTARVDLDVEPAEVIPGLSRSGADQVIAITFVDVELDACLADDGGAARTEFAAAGMNLVAAYVATPGSWRDQCSGPWTTRPDVNLAVSSQAVGAGLVARAHRSEVVEDVHGIHASAEIRQQMAAAIDAAMTCDVERDDRWVRSETRALFRTARDRQRSTADVARAVVALTAIEVRDAAWLAVEADRLDTDDLCRSIVSVLDRDDPRVAPASFLLAWSAWRRGEGVVASEFTNFALDADPNYSAALLLQQALTMSLSPFKTPRLRKAA